MERRRGVARGRIAITVVGAFLLASCSAAEPAPPSAQLSPPTLEAIGILAEERIADPNRTYVLADGRRFDVSSPVTRVLWNGGRPGQPIVLGSDGTGPFVAVFAEQDGLPDGCHIPGIGAPGIDRGTFIEIKGVLWHKASSFDPANAPPTGTRYPSSTRFCFDDEARVASTVP